MKPDSSTADGVRASLNTTFLAGGGEMGALIRAHAWADTRLGPPEGWPPALKIALRILLTSRQPFWIGWGEELAFFYNDAYRSIVGGKHPAALGQPTSPITTSLFGMAAATCLRMASTCAAASDAGSGKSSQYGRI